MVSERIPLSVVILAKNEQDNIRTALESVQAWADEIIVVDDASLDETVKIAKEFTDKVFSRKMDIEGRHRNWAYKQAKNEWVLSLDADERVTDELKDEIGKVISQDTNFSAFSIPLRNYIGNYWVRHGGWYPAGKVRLFKKDKFRYEEAEVHPRVFIEGSCGHLRADIIHKGYPDISHFVNSLNHQTSLEARKWISTDRKMALGKALWRTLDRFVRTYFIKKGYRDGIIGLVVATFAGFYQFLSYAKYWEMKTQMKPRLTER
jgi:glycosyltransferase involved in cell wall biosynthesis